jgi:hypothetical protein
VLAFLKIKLELLQGFSEWVLKHGPVTKKYPMPKLLSQFGCSKAALATA